MRYRRERPPGRPLPAARPSPGRRSTGGAGGGRHPAVPRETRGCGTVGETGRRDGKGVGAECRGGYESLGGGLQGRELEPNPLGGLQVRG